MNTVKFSLDDKPSHSKGWGRYSVSQATPEGTRRVIESNTGNEWVSSSKEGQAEIGSEIVLTSQVLLHVGKRHTARDEIKTLKHTLIVEDGATCEIVNKPGSQGVRITVTGARLVV